jgi:hypothetical protein
MATVEKIVNVAGGGRTPSGYVQARAAVTSSEQITVPAGATHVIFSATGAFHVAFGADPTATVPADTDDGTASELVNPATPSESRTFYISGVAKIAVAAASSVMITAAFFKL